MECHLESLEQRLPVYCLSTMVCRCGGSKERATRYEKGIVVLASQFYVTWLPWLVQCSYSDEKDQKNSCQGPWSYLQSSSGDCILFIMASCERHMCLSSICLRHYPKHETGDSYTSFRKLDAFLQADQRCSTTTTSHLAECLDAFTGTSSFPELAGTRRNAKEDARHGLSSNSPLDVTMPATGF